MKIQWYPGHMTKARRNMESDVKIIDLIIELLDARAPLSTRNPDIDKIGRNKARVVILNKSDMADPSINSEWYNYFCKLGYECMLMDSRNKKNLSELSKIIDKACEEKRERDLKKGIKNRPVRAMIVGIPNVGKSTLINTISGKSVVKTGNKPGVTRGNQWIRLNKGLELLDTPGILWPKFEDESIGENLAYIGSINEMIIDTSELCANFIMFLYKNYKNIFKEKFFIEEDVDMDISFAYKVLEDYAIKKSCLLKGGVADVAKAANMIMTEFKNGKTGKISLERPIND